MKGSVWCSQKKFWAETIKDIRFFSPFDFDCTEYSGMGEEDVL